MEDTTTLRSDQDSRIAEWANHGKARLRNFIRKRVADPSDTEDILQDALYELVAAFRMMRPVEHIGPWLFRVARNRIIDAYRKAKPERSIEDRLEIAESGESVEFGELLPSPDAGPEAAYSRVLLLEELDEALGDLPQEQREVFIAHEFEGRSFKQLSAETGVSVNTLLSRKHYAVLRLRQRLQAIYDELEKG
jgi:RNA polymerase sigma factor (sigma-70 family)